MPSAEQHWEVARLREIRGAEQCRQWQDDIDQMYAEREHVRADYDHVWALPTVRANPLSWVALPPPEIENLRRAQLDFFEAGDEVLGLYILGAHLGLLARIGTLRALTRRRQAMETFIKNEYKKKVMRGEALTEENLVVLGRFVGEAEYVQHDGVIEGHFELAWDIGRSLRARFQGSCLSAATFEPEVMGE
tara:strand:+ start:10682 stop:11254 length:573 start_codon:yes stop_codon:yes gene_type:complete